MAEVEGMTDAQLQAAIREMDSVIRKEKNEFTNVKKQCDDLNKRLAENNNKLKLFVPPNASKSL